jgi:hypothetical protein
LGVLFLAENKFFTYGEGIAASRAKIGNIQGKVKSDINRDSIAGLAKSLKQTNGTPIAFSKHD